MPYSATDERSQSPESVSTIPGILFNIPESLFRIPGIRVHVRLESVFEIVRNTHLLLISAARRSRGGFRSLEAPISRSEV